METLEPLVKHSSISQSASLKMEYPKQSIIELILAEAKKAIHSQKNQESPLKFRSFEKLDLLSKQLNS